jgi:hypothetical protein
MRDVFPQGYKFSDSLFDLLVLAAARVSFALVAFLISYVKGEIRPEYSFNMYHDTGVKKSREELEEEALEQSFSLWFRSYVKRPAFLCEFVSMSTMILCIVKCLVRLDREVGNFADSHSMHPVIWCTILVSSLVSILELCFVDSVCVVLGEWGHAIQGQDNPSFLQRISSTLSLPLLANDSMAEADEETDQAEAGTRDENAEPDDNVTGVSDIGGDAKYTASWRDLLMLCAPDTLLILAAFFFLLLAAAAQIYIPTYTGRILDKLTETFAGDDDDTSHKSMKDVPGFMENVRKLIAASILGGVFSGVRGSIFTIVGARTNVRLRLQLMDSLLVQGKIFVGM